MKKFSLPIAFSLLSIIVCAQNTNISGSINLYSKVTAIEYCGNRVIVDTPSLFQVGMQVLIIQMQGATIDQTNTANYGNILNYNYAGNYEIQTIDSILGDTIKFKYQLARRYDPAQSVQLMPLPIYQTATVTGVLTCRAWEGNTGGVLLLKADTLILNDTIDISGTGFRGFYENDSSQLCFGNLTDYFYTDSMHGGIKGEGIVQYPYLFGRGKNANGGGGGDNENTGGGGGSNFGQGGLGGQIVYRTTACLGNSPGVGGAALTYNDTLNKIFMGGGGGCGHGNNSEGTPGTNGAGICLIIANVLIGNNQYIVANGIDQLNIAGSDGAGAGGAGGTVLLDVGQYSGNLYVTATGGIGGSLDNDQLTRSCMGPAGGGSGGVLWVSQAAVPPNIIYSAAGGANGINLDLVSTLCAYGATNGALPGDTGGSATGLVVPIPSTPYIRLGATASDDTTVCNDQRVMLSATGISSDSVYYVWSTGQQTPSVSFLASQTSPYTVTVSDQNTCTAAHQINVTVINMAPNFSPGSFLCSPQNITLTALNPGNPAVTYAWSNGVDSPSITFFADSSVAYSVTVTSDSLASCMAIDTIHVGVGNLNVTFLPALNTAVCPGNPVVLSAIDSSAVGLTYTWSTGASADSITVSPTALTTYDVTVSAGAGCSVTHSFVVDMDYLGTVISPDTTICPGGTASIAVTVPNVNNVSYLWSTGQTTEQVNVSTHTTQAYTVTVSSTNGCTGTATMTVDVDSVLITAPDTIVCPGSTATLYAHAAGAGTISYLWSTGAVTVLDTVTSSGSQAYTISATDSLGCRTVDSVYVTTSNNASHLMLQITATPDSAAAPGDTVQLSVTGQRMVSFLWTPGIYLSDSSIRSPIDIPQTQTDYCVTVTDSSHCAVQACKEIAVGAPAAMIAIPSAFTPNDDGINDIYRIPATEGTVIATMKIYSRWGQLLYDDMADLGWDGTYGGVAQPNATYTCFVTYYQKLHPNIIFSKMGIFDLFR